MRVFAAILLLVSACAAFETPDYSKEINEQNRFLSSTPFELCSQNDTWKRFGTIEDCKTDMRREQDRIQRLRQQLIQNMLIYGMPAPGIR